MIFLRPEYIDGYLAVIDDQANRGGAALPAGEGIFAGFSSGANIAAAIRLRQGACRGKVVATIINDSGVKYLSTNLWG